MGKYIIVDIDLELLYDMLYWHEHKEEDLALKEFWEELCDDDDGSYDLPF